jgi:hypothetical protein
MLIVCQIAHAPSCTMCVTMQMDNRQMIDSHSRHDAPMATLFLSFFVPIQCYPCLNCQSHLSVLSTLSFFKLHYHQDSLPLGSLHLLNSENHHYTALEFVSDAFCVNDDPFQPSFHLLVISGYTPDKTSKGRATKNNGMS